MKPIACLSQKAIDPSDESIRFEMECTIPNVSFVEEPACIVLGDSGCGAKNKLDTPPREATQERRNVDARWYCRVLLYCTNSAHSP